MLISRSSFPLLITLTSCFVACSATKSGGDENGNGSASSNGDGSGLGVGDGNGTGDGLDVGNGDGDENNGGPICQSYQAESEKITPVVLMLLDQSGSMAEPRWSHATEAINTAAANLETFAKVGFIGFPTHPISSVDVYNETCGAELKVAPGGTAAEIGASIHPTAPLNGQGHTPVRAALELAGAELAKPEHAFNSKYIVLITDGIPNCASSNVGSFWQPEDPSDAVTVLHDQGVTTFVVGYQLSSTAVDGFTPTETANNMATAGGTDNYREVVDGVALNAELEAIRKLIIPCEFELNEPPRGGPTYVRVTIDDTDYALDEAWTLEGEKTVSLTEGGAACNVLRDGGTHQVKIEVECEPVTVR